MKLFSDRTARRNARDSSRAFTRRLGWTRNLLKRKSRIKKFIRIGLSALWIGTFALSDSPRAAAEVTIAAFNAQVGAGQVKLVWTTATERKNWGFNIERSTDQKSWQHVGANPSVKSQSPCIQNVLGAAYEFTDPGLAPGVRYYYRLQTIGQPCGDPNTYHEEIISALVNAPTATPVFSRTASPTATATTPVSVSPIPSATRSAVPRFTPSRAPMLASPRAIPSPTQIAVLQNRFTPSPSRQHAATPFVQPSPIVAARIVPREESSDSVESASASRAKMIDARDWIRGGVFGLASLLGFAACVCGALALAVYIQRR